MWCPSPGSTANLRAKKMTPRGCAAGFCADARNHKARHSRLWNKNNKNKKYHRRNEAPLCADRRAGALPPTKAFRRRSAKLQSRPQSSWCKRRRRREALEPFEQQFRASLDPVVYNQKQTRREGHADSSVVSKTHTQHANLGGSPCFALPLRQPRASHGIAPLLKCI